MGVSVDRDFARFGAKSYAINKINSVEVRSVKPNKPDMAVVAGIAAVGLAWYGINMAIQGEVADITYLILAIVVAAFAWLLWKQSQIVEYQLFLMTSSSETQAFASRDEEEVLILRSKIEAAMAGRA